MHIQIVVSDAYSDCRAMDTDADVNDIGSFEGLLADHKTTSSIREIVGVCIQAPTADGHRYRASSSLR
jgi:hypothetical protein